MFVIPTVCVRLLPRGTLPKPKADGASAICCECAVDGRILRRTETKRKGAQGLTKPKLVTDHTYAVRNSAQRGNGGALSVSGRTDRAAKRGDLVGFSPTSRVFTRSRWDSLRRAGDKCRIVQFSEGGRLPDQEAGGSRAANGSLVGSVRIISDSSEVLQLCHRMTLQDLVDGHDIDETRTAVNRG